MSADETATGMFHEDGSPDAEAILAQLRRVVQSDPPPATIGAYAGREVLHSILGEGADAEARAKVAAAFSVFRACADPNIVYDFSSETEMRGDRFVIVITATPRNP